MNQRMNRKKKNRRRIFKLVMILSIAMVMFFHFIPAEKSQGVVKYDKVVVCSGDTLWSIASQYIAENQDVREMIYDIRKLNSLSSAMLIPGQELLIPCSE